MSLKKLMGNLGMINTAILQIDKQDKSPKKGRPDVLSNGRINNL